MVSLSVFVLEVIVFSVFAWYTALRHLFFFSLSSSLFSHERFSEELHI